jgi:hypothetical protein
MARLTDYKPAHSVHAAYQDHSSAIACGIALRTDRQLINYVVHARGGPRGVACN